jgi:peptide/nickel transport system substrate-binding protein
MRAPVTRRSLVRSFLLGGVGLLVAECTPAAPPQAPAAAPTTPAAATPGAAPVAPPQTAPTVVAPQPAVQRLVIGSPPPAAEGSNPARDQSPNDIYQLRPMYEGLIGNDPVTGAWAPQLAESWSVEPDGKSIRFKLRKGVQFHNGFGEFTAKDVVYTVEDLMNQDSQSSNSGVMRDLLETMEVINDYEVVAHTRVPDYGILFAFSLSTGGMEIRSKADADSRGGKTTGVDVTPVAGTGPYQFSERAAGQFIRFSRVPYKHWRATPDFPELEYRWQPDNSTRLAALLSGETHLVPLTRDALKDAESRGMKIFEGQQVGVPVAVRFLGAYLKDPKDPAQGYMYPNSPVMDQRVRAALSKACDRNALQRIFLNQGEPMYLRSRHQSQDGWNPDWEKQFPAEYGYDPAGAKQLLSDAGFGPSNPLKFSAVAQQGNAVEAVDVMDAVSSMWRNVGIDATLETMDMAAWRTKLRGTQFSNHADYIVSTGYPTFLQFRLNTGLNPQRGGAFEDPRIDDGYRKVITEVTDDAKRTQAWKDLGDVDFGLHTHIPLFWLRIGFAGNPKVISSYTFPGNLGSFVTHYENIKSA